MLGTRAGRFRFWRVDAPLEQALSPTYERATQGALEWLAAHPDPDAQERLAREEPQTTS